MLVEFDEICRFLVKCSPNRTIMFQSRYQGGDHEIICGVININKFFSLLNRKKILFNTCYIFCED